MRFIVVVLPVIIGCAAVAAEPDSLYEPLSELQLGRVFLTPSERERLDRQRGAAVNDDPVLHAVSESESRTAAPRRKPAAGIIVAEGGRPLVWVGGEFRRVDAASIEDIDFSVEPSIRIHANPQTDRTADVPATAAETDGAQRPEEVPAAVRVAGTEFDDERNEN